MHLNQVDEPDMEAAERELELRKEEPDVVSRLSSPSAASRLQLLRVLRPPCNPSRPCLPRDELEIISQLLVRKGGCSGTLVLVRNKTTGRAYCRRPALIVW